MIMHTNCNRSKIYFAGTKEKDMQHWLFFSFRCQKQWLNLIRLSFLIENKVTVGTYNRQQGGLLYCRLYLTYNYSFFLQYNWSKTFAFRTQVVKYYLCPTGWKSATTIQYFIIILVLNFKNSKQILRKLEIEILQIFVSPNILIWRI
jgi:hypothetical protein